MPIVPCKRKNQVEEQLAQRAKRSKLNHHEMFSKIGYTEDHHHSLYREIPLIGIDFEKIVRREVGSFLNGSGGIIAFGVRTNGTILGNKLTRKEEDNFKLAVDRIMVGFHPIVKPAMYRLIIEPVYDKYKSWVGNSLFLIQLKINKGEPYSLYEDGEHEVFIRQGSSPKGPLTAREIKERVTAEYEQRCKESKKKEMAPKNIEPVGQRKEEDKETKTTKEITTAKTTTAKTVPKTTTVKIVPKTNDTVSEGKGGNQETKAVTKTKSVIVKIRKPLATKN